VSQTQVATGARTGVPARPGRGLRGRGLRGRGLRGNPALTLLAVALGVMMVGIDGTIVAVANPSIQAHLHASLADIQWVTNGYLLALAVMLITVGKVGDRFGHKKVFLTGIIGFAATSAAVGLSGLSRIGIAASLGGTVLWFVLLGLGLSPVMVGATDVIVGNASVELAGVAGGLQSTAMQVGGTIGTAVLGAIMTAKVDSLLPVHWATAHLPSLTPAQLAQVKSATSVGVAPVTHGTPAHVAELITSATHSTFISGMDASFLVAAIVTLVGAAIALLAKRGHATEGAAVI
jgi:MFS family permease